MINIQNTGNNECFKWYLVRYLHLADHHTRRNKTFNKLYAEKVDFIDKKFLFKVRDIHKIERKNSIGISVFGYEYKEKYPIYLSKNAVKISMLIYY